VNCDKGTVYGIEYQFHCIGNNTGNIGIPQFVPGGSHRFSYRQRKITVCKFFSTDWTNMWPKVTVSWILTSDKMKMLLDHYKLESKWQSMKWWYVNSPSNKMFKIQPSVGKVTCPWWSLWISWNPEQTINSDYCITTLTVLKAWTSRVRPERKTTFLWQHSNDRLHTSLKTVKHIASLGWTVLPHSPYSLDLVPSDFHFSGQWKMDCLDNIFLVIIPS